MPIYEYECGACGHRLEAFQKMSESPLTDCPECHKSALQKLVSAAGFQLKGTGWYVTDFRDKNKPASSTTSSSTKTETNTKTEGGSSGTSSNSSGGTTSSES